jgi:adenylylsulfate kinase-like enzyme
MGCDSSKQSVTRKGQVLYLHGYPCAGKTFYTDYLNSIGWEMVDGDWPLYSKSNKVAKDFMDGTNYIYALQKGEPVKDKDRQYMINHFRDMARKAKRMQDRGKNVVISFIGMQSFLRAELPKIIPDITFAFIEVEIATLVERNFKRLESAGEMQGMTMEQQWAFDDPETTKLRAKYGEVYSEEKYKQWLRDEWYAHYDPVTEEEKPFSHVIKNTGYSVDGLKQLRDILKLEGEFEYKPEELIQKQKERYATVNQAAF